MVTAPPVATPYDPCEVSPHGGEWVGCPFHHWVSTYLAWDARQNTRAKYDAWARCRQDVDAGFVRYDIHNNEIYHTPGRLRSTRENSDPCVAGPHECTNKVGGGSENPWSDPDTWGGGGGGDPAPPENTDPAKSYEQGPLLWGACVLAMVGSTYSITLAAGKFETWYKAYKDAEGAQRLWLAAVENNVDVTRQMLLEYQYQQARLRQEDAAGAVSEATHTSYLALFTAAVACGATALVPSP